MGQHPRTKRKDSQKKKRRETGHYLTYYQSAIADGRSEDSSDSDGSQYLVRQATGEDSASSSDYSSEDSRTTLSKTTGFSTTTHYLYPDVNPLPVGTRLRAANASEGGGDRRRMAIVEMDAASGQSSPEIPSSIQSEETSSIRSRRDLKPNLAGLALVAPPDAAPKTYSHLTPPTTGPHTTDSITREISSKMPESPRVLQKRRSTREQNSAPRGRGVTSPKSSNPRVMLSNNEHALPHINYPTSRRSRSPSPPSSSSKSTSERPGPSHARRDEQDGNSLLPQQHDRHRVATPKSSRQSLQQLTPEIGQYKDIATRVAAPVVISLDSAAPLRRKDNSTSNQSSRRSSPPGVRSASSAHFPPSSKDRSTMPGLHNTAGPPPPPPRAVFSIDASMPAPPRPPRLHSPNPPTRAKDIENLKQALQLPPSVTAALASKSPKSNSTPPPPSTVVEQDDKQRSSHPSLNHSKSIHRREGAFSPSGSNASEDTDPAPPTENPRNSALPQPQSSSIENATTTSPTAPDGISTDGSVADESEDIVPPMVTVRPLRFSDEQSQSPFKKHDGLTDVTNDLDLTPSRKRRSYNGSGSSSDYSNSSNSPTRRSSRHGSTNSMTTDTPNSKTPSPPPKTGLMRTSLSLSLKRFSALPRTPTSSVSSKSIRRTSTSSTHYSSRTPSPSLQSYEPSRYQDLPPPFKKIRSQHPPAMFCAEVFARKTSLERCLLYAQKINELYVHDSGLEDWTFETRIRATTNRPSVGPASQGPQPRHSSRNSIISEATFPIRSDAYTATDITTKEDDIAPVSPINLPYPSLATQTLQPLKSSSSVGHGSGIGTPPSSIRSLTSSNPSVKSGGFFSSIGRKASMSASKKDKVLLSPTTPMSVVTKLTKTPPAPIAKPNISATIPAIPGGPRAIPGSRPMRSKTLMIHTTSISEREGVARRPSLADVHHSPVGPVLDISPDPGFVRQVDKLADLLPEADRDVLAGYLRRAGQDMLAIGQYLEDEKNGTLKRY